MGDKDRFKWNIKDFMGALQAKVELRTCHSLTSSLGTTIMAVTTHDGDASLVTLVYFSYQSDGLCMLYRKS